MDIGHHNELSVVSFIITFKRVGLDSKKRFLAKRCEKRGKEGKRWEKKLLGTRKVHMI